MRKELTVSELIIRIKHAEKMRDFYSCTRRQKKQWQDMVNMYKKLKGER